MLRQPNNQSSGITMPRGIANTMLDLYNPRRSVIIDMVMVQFISIIITMLLILFLQGPSMSSGSISFYLIGLFTSVLMLSGVYAKIH